MKKVPITHNTAIEDLKLNNDRAPNYLGLKFCRFEFIVPSSSQVVKTTNHPRKVEKKSGNCDQLSASLKRGWIVGSFPPSFIEKNGKLQLLNGRHTLDAFLQSQQYHRMPAAIYTRVPSGDKDFDDMSFENQDTINGMKANVDGTCNTHKDDFVYATNKVILQDNLDRDIKKVTQILEWCNFNERYNYIGTKTEIINRVLNVTKGKTSTKVFNTTVEERHEWMKENPEFGENNTSAEGYKLRSTCVEEKSNFEDYARRIFYSALDAAEANIIEKRIIWSSSTHEDQIKLDRNKLVSIVTKCHNSPRNYFYNHIKSEFKKSPFIGNISLPNCDLDNLPLELWAGPQIDGETEAIRLI